MVVGHHVCPQCHCPVPIAAFESAMASTAECLVCPRCDGLIPMRSSLTGLPDSAASRAGSPSVAKNPEFVVEL